MRNLDLSGYGIGMPYKNYSRIKKVIAGAIIVIGSGLFLAYLIKYKPIEK
ncbi:MAG TPA: hypothetical protein VL576_01845 [Candidatus Paceibacterota bacterium]|jgi:hypothetical protein|nr:hypothetical protein [Candidatus Paceibacterota bacterium]